MSACHILSEAWTECVNENVNV